MKEILMIIKENYTNSTIVYTNYTKRGTLRCWWTREQLQLRYLDLRPESSLTTVFA